MRVLTLLTCAAAISAACSRSTFTPVPAPEIDQRYLVQVTSHHWSAVALYATRGGIRRQIGEILPGERRAVIVDQGMIDSDGALHLAGRVVGSPQSFAMEPIVVHPGEYVDWTLEDAPERWHVGVYQAALRH